MGRLCRGGWSGTHPIIRRPPSTQCPSGMALGAAAGGAGPSGCHGPNSCPQRVSKSKTSYPRGFRKPILKLVLLTSQVYFPSCHSCLSQISPCPSSLGCNQFQKPAYSIPPKWNSESSPVSICNADLIPSAHLRATRNTRLHHPRCLAMIRSQSHWEPLEGRFTLTFSVASPGSGIFLGFVNTHE